MSREQPEPIEEQEKPDLATQCVDRLLERHGIPVRQRQNYVADQLGLSYQQARRRMLGTPPWTLEELASLATRFGETLATMVGDSGPGASRHATFITGTLRLDCELWLGAETQRPTGPLVATQPSGGDWIVVPATEAAGSKLYEVDRILIQRRASKPRRVAILDDDRDLATSIAEYMTASGVIATPFFSAADLAAAIAKQPYDGYVLDWLLNNEGTARTLIASIREHDPACPIIILTGQFDNGAVQESELTAISASYGLSFLAKPARSGSIMSTLQLGFARPAA